MPEEQTLKSKQEKTKIWKINLSEIYQKKINSLYPNYVPFGPLDNMEILYAINDLKNLLLNQKKSEVPSTSLNSDKEKYFYSSDLSQYFGCDMTNWLHKNNHILIMKLEKAGYKILRGKHGKYRYPSEVIPIIQEMKEL